MAAKKKTAKKTAKPKALEYVIVRCTQAGVHAGYLVKQTKEHLTLIDSRRIWYWSGAASISEIAVHGLNPAKSSASKIAAKVPRIQLRQSDVCEVVLCCAEGKASVEGCHVWRA